jgi:hypothetical protein
MASREEYPEEYLHESRQATIYAVTIVFMVLETIAVALRFIAKIVGRLSWGLDDGFITLGYALCMSVAACTIGIEKPVREVLVTG